jgi:hypothetical protein
MATNLRDRLTDLAGHTPPGAPPPDLWTRGVRRRRLAQAGTTALVAVLILLVGVGGWTVHRTQRGIEPVDTRGTAHLPDRFFAPSPWLHAFDGPPGRLVAVGVAERKSLLHSTTSAYGVTASGGEYGFLDLSGLADRVDYASAVPPALSPDGRYVAYWVTGTPSGSANTQLYGQTITGVAIFDAVTGQTQKAELRTAHGLAPETLAWSDRHTLVMGVGQTLSGDDNDQLSGAADQYRLMGWRSGEDGPRPFVVPDGLDAYNAITAGHRSVVVAANGRASWLIWPRHPGRDRRLRVPDLNSTTVVSPGATREASVAGNRNPNHLVVGSMERDVARTRLEPVNGDRQYYRPMVWTDERHVVALVRNPYRHTRDPLTARLDLVDVRTGSARTLVDHLEGGGRGWHELSFATDLFTAPSAHATPPPRPWDLRVTVGLAAFVLLCAGLFGWRISARRP